MTMPPSTEINIVLRCATAISCALVLLSPLPNVTVFADASTVEEKAKQCDDPSGNDCAAPNVLPEFSNNNDNKVNGHNDVDDDNDPNPCLLYLAESTIKGAGLGMFAGKPFKKEELIGRNYGDAAFPTVDQDWHVSPIDGHISKHEGDYHWMLTNYDWNAPDIGMEYEAEDVSATVTGFGAAPNCHFRLLNVAEHEGTYDNAGLDRYSSPGAGASTPWFNRTSTAKFDIAAGSELFVDYGSNWFLSREGVFDLVPIPKSYKAAQHFLWEYGKLLSGKEKYTIEDLVEDKMVLGDEVQRDLWELIKTFPYPTREREALPDSHKDAIRAIFGDIRTVEVENSIRPMDYLKEHGKCVDNIVPGHSSIPHAGRGAFATRFIPKGGLVAPAPVVHIADKSNANMYGEMIGPYGNVVRNESELVTKQIILNYCFGHPKSTLLLFPYSSYLAYINHDATNYNAELRWATNFSFFHHEDWLTKPVEFLEEQWTSGLALEFIATRDIQPGEEVLIDYGKEWQEAWDEHVKNWKPIPKESDYNNLTLWTEEAETNNGPEGYVRAEILNEDRVTPLRTMEEQKKNPYPHSIDIMCRLNLNHNSPYFSSPLTIPFFKRNWKSSLDFDDSDTHVKCNITERRHWADEEDEEEDDHEDEHLYGYTVEAEIQKLQSDSIVINESHVIMNVPRSAIVFVNKYYTSDIYLKGAFRHEMGLPDGVFPEAWMNLINKDTDKGDEN